jgi:hypothetical protein
MITGSLPKGNKPQQQLTTGQIIANKRRFDMILIFDTMDIPLHDTFFSS